VILGILITVAATNIKNIFAVGGLPFKRMVFERKNSFEKALTSAMLNGILIKSLLGDEIKFAL
jgi:hypothetical protein